MSDNVENAVLDILKQIQAGQSAMKKELRAEIGSVRQELQLMQQQLMTLNGSLFHQRSEYSRLEDRIARLEAHIGVEDTPPPTH